MKNLLLSLLAVFAFASPAFAGFADTDNIYGETAVNLQNLDSNCYIKVLDTDADGDGTVDNADSDSTGATSYVSCADFGGADPYRSYVFEEEFMQFTSAGALATPYNLVSIDDGATGTNAGADGAGGILNLVTAAGDNDYHALASGTEPFLFAAGKKAWCEARFKIAEATTNESAWWFGLTDTLTTGGLQANAAGPLASYDGALIWKDEATMTIDFETSNAGTQATDSELATAVTDTWTRAAFYFDGTATTATITPYLAVNGATTLTAYDAQDITLSGLEEMHVVIGVKAGPTAAAETLQIDYVRCEQLR